MEEYMDVPLTKPLRLIEMVFCMVLIGLLITIDDYIAIMTYLSLMYITFGGFLMITMTDVISQIVADPIPDTPMFLLCLAGCALFLAAGGLGLDCVFDVVKLNLPPDPAKVKTIMTELTAVASLSIINGAIFLLDCALIFRDQTAVKKLIKKPTSPEVEDRLMEAARKPRDVRHREAQERAHGDRREEANRQQRGSYVGSHIQYYSSSQETSLPGTPYVSERHTSMLKISTTRSEGNLTQRSSSRSSFQPHVRPARTSRTKTVIFNEEEHHMDTPRSGGPLSRKKRRRRKVCRILIWQKERKTSVFLKVVESALGIACLWIFVREVWLEESTSPLTTAITFSAIVTATTLAVAVTINTLARNPAHRIPFLLSAATGAGSYCLIASMRFTNEDNLKSIMETPVLFTGAVSLVDAALCLATFINNSAAGEQPQRPARRLDKARNKQPEPAPEDITVKKPKKNNFFIRAKKFFKKSEPQ